LIKAFGTNSTEAGDACFDPSFKELAIKLDKERSQMHEQEKSRRQPGPLML
jgi:hypothetical protein